MRFTARDQDHVCRQRSLADRTTARGVRPWVGVRLCDGGTSSRATSRGILCRCCLVDTLASGSKRSVSLPTGSVRRSSRLVRTDARRGDYVGGGNCDRPSGGRNNSPRRARARNGCGNREQHKQTGRYGVLVRDLDSLGSSDFTASLERSLTAALSTAFPSRSIRIERETAGPALGP